MQHTFVKEKNKQKRNRERERKNPPFPEALYSMSRHVSFSPQKSISVSSGRDRSSQRQSEEQQEVTLSLAIEQHDSRRGALMGSFLHLFAVS